MFFVTDGKTDDPLASLNIDPIWRHDFPMWAGQHEDICTTCNQGGTLLLCDGPCVGSFHLHCVNLSKTPEVDVWLCPQCTELKRKRQEIFALTGGQSSRFKPGKYKITVWMDNDNQDMNDVYKALEIQAKCFYPSKNRKSSKIKKSKNSSKNKNKRKRSRSEFEQLSV